MGALGRLEKAAKVTLKTACLFLVTSLGGCGSRSPSANDVEGNWVAEDGGRLVLSPDGTMHGEKLRIGMPFERSPPAAISGSGTWRLRAKPGVWEFGTYWWDVQLNFDHLQNVQAEGLNEQIEYGPPVFLLGPAKPVLQLWPDAEPSDRAQEFVRKKSF